MRERKNYILGISVSLSANNTFLDDVADIIASHNNHIETQCNSQFPNLRLRILGVGCDNNSLSSFLHRQLTHIDGMIADVSRIFCGGIHDLAHTLNVKSAINCGIPVVLVGDSRNLGALKAEICATPLEAIERVLSHAQTNIVGISDEEIYSADRHIFEPLVRNLPLVPTPSVDGSKERWKDWIADFACFGRSGLLYAIAVQLGSSEPDSQCSEFVVKRLKESPSEVEHKMICMVTENVSAVQASDRRAVDVAIEAFVNDGQYLETDADLTHIDELQVKAGIRSLVGDIHDDIIKIEQYSNPISPSIGTEISVADWLEESKKEAPSSGQIFVKQVSSRGLNPFIDDSSLRTVIDLVSDVRGRYWTQLKNIGIEV